MGHPREALNPARAPGRERRGARRYAVRLEIAYEDAQRQFFAATVDFSSTGVFVAAAQNPPLGAVARILLELPGDDRFVRLHGRVVRGEAAREGGRPAGFALRFEGASEPLAERCLERLLEPRLSTAG